jgi:hypothetical protein
MTKLRNPLRGYKLNILQYVEFLRYVTDYTFSTIHSYCTLGDYNIMYPSTVNDKERGRVQGFSARGPKDNLE